MEKYTNYKIGKKIAQIYRNNLIALSKDFANLKLGAGQYVFLAQLFETDGINQEELSEILKIDKANTARALKKLEEEGYIRRERDLYDKRAYKVYITNKALEIKEKFFEILTKNEARFLKGFEKSEILLLKNMLDRITNEIGGKNG